MFQRFKIDLYDSCKFPFALYHKTTRKRLWRGDEVEWNRLDIFEEKDQAMAFYERVKDLPIYLP